MDGYDREIGNIVINLHDIVTGPHEQDFAFNMKVKGKDICRYLM